MALLKMVSGAGQCIELKGDVCVIGKAPECDIVLDPNGVSRRHAEIRRQGDNFVVDDMHSRNTTKVNNAVLVPGKGHVLKEGDVINICDVEFSFHVSRESAAAPPKPVPGEMVVTEYGGESLFHIQDASVASSMPSPLLGPKSSWPRSSKSAAISATI